MALTIVATAGSASANSFATEAEFIAYLEKRLNAHSGATTTGATCTDNEKRALLEAGITLNQLAWKEGRTDTTQAMAWPRKWVYDPDAPNPAEIGDVEELYFDDTEIPARVKRGQMALAVEFLKAGTTDIAALDATIGVKQKTVDVLTTVYADPHQRAQGLNRFPRVMAEIAPLLEGSAGGIELSRV